MRRVPRLAVLLGVWCAAAAAAPAQRAEGPVLSVRTDLVTLSVTVVDRHGALVDGLRAEHFTVYDNGEPQTIQFFASTDLPATLGLLVDSSGSKRGRSDLLIAAANAFAALHHPLDEAFTLQFNERVWPGLAVPAAQGMTALYDAIDVGLTRIEQGTRDRRALVLLSDGGDNASRQTLAAILTRARRTSAVIYSVTLVDPDNRDARPDVLKKLARETGGQSVTAKRAADMPHAFADIGRVIRSGYTIGFAPPPSPDGGFRTIRVVADAGDGRELVARTRAGYDAGPSDGGR